MFKMALNHLRLDFAIQPNGPLLIKSGQETGANPLLPAMSFVRSIHPYSRTSTIYLPGSSLKGVIRSRCEQIARTVNLKVDEFNAHELHNHKADQFRNSEATSGEVVNAYSHVCSITRMFGSTNLASRVQLTDFYPPDPIDVLPIRQMVAIDRRTGASANTFTMEVAPPALNDEVPVLFYGTIHLQNFERWQVGLIALALRDLNAGQVPVGFGSSRGLGQVRLYYRTLQVSYPGILTKDEATQSGADRYLLGVAQLNTALSQGSHGFDQSSLPETRDFEAEVTADWAQAVVRLGAAQPQESNDKYWDQDHDTIESVFRNQAKYDWVDYVSKQHEIER